MTDKKKQCDIKTWTVVIIFLVTNLQFKFIEMRLTES